MAEPIVFISRLRLHGDGAKTFAPMFGGAVSSIGASKPRTAVFAGYVGGNGEDVAIVHVFPDAVAMTQHFQGSDDRAGTIEGLVEYVGFEVYGAAPPAAVEQLGREADVTGATLTVYPTSIGGYLTAPG